jgi:sucrose-phosphate synthase
MDRRINAEEETLGAASLVITSTTQEIEEQYGLYDHYQPERMSVIPPGTDLEALPAAGRQRAARRNQAGDRPLPAPAEQADDPGAVATGRAQEHRHADRGLRRIRRAAARANLVIVAGNRDDIRELDSGAQQVLTDILILIDLYDLYGRVAYPKHHSADEVPMLYRLAAASRGVFINPALTEPFGLTLIEAAASGLPIVATEDGGPIDIIKHCNNGILIDPLDKQDITKALLKVISDRGRWRQHRAQRARRRQASTIPGRRTPRATWRRCSRCWRRCSRRRARRWRAGRCSITTGPSSPTWTRTCSATRTHWRTSSA